MIGGETQLKQGVNEMRLVDLRIKDIAFGGKGVAREQGKAVFVPYTIEGELVSGEIIREKTQFAEADLVEVKESSPHRVAAKCPYFARCGGCGKNEPFVRFHFVGGNPETRCVRQPDILPRARVTLFWTFPCGRLSRLRASTRIATTSPCMHRMV